MPKDLNVYQLREIERMEEYQQANPYAESPETVRRVMAAVVLVLIIMAFVALAIPTRAEPEGDHWICQSAAIYSFAPGAMQAEWDDPAQTWRVLETHDPATPDDDEWHYWAIENTLDTGILYADQYQNDSSPAYGDYYDTRTGLLWRFAFIDTTSTYEGGRYGMHHSCPQGPVVFNLNSED